MSEIFLECAPGISGDMFLASLYDLGVPKAVIEAPLKKMGLDKLYSLNFSEAKSSSIRGISVEVKIVEDFKKRDWRFIKEIIFKANLETDLRTNIIKVFQSLAEAEGNVHGINPDDVHFHEIGSIDSLLDIVGVCAGFHYLKPDKVYCNSPTLGNGFINTEHGNISVPSPAVIELIKKNKIKVRPSISSSDGELSTPTGIALLANLVNSFEVLNQFSIISYGVGIGKRKLPYPNLLRVMKIKTFDLCKKNYTVNPHLEEICIQEAWIDDQTPEEISSFIQILREAGAYDVAYQTINMKKDRTGFALMVLLPIDMEQHFRDLWFQFSNTIGIRERRQRRWILPRRSGECLTSFGKLRFKQVLNPNGEISIKLENDEILELQKKYKKSAQDIKTIINKSLGKFEPSEDWK